MRDDDFEIFDINENDKKENYLAVSFKSDKDKINLEERIKKLSPETEINIL